MCISKYCFANFTQNNFFFFFSFLLLRSPHTFYHHKRSNTFHSFFSFSFSSWFTSHHTFRSQKIFSGSIEHFTVSHRKRSFIKRQTSGVSSDEGQRMTTSGATNDKWLRKTTSGTSENEWQQITTSGTTSDKDWQRVIQRVTTNGNEWQRVTAVVQQMQTAQYTSKNGWLPCFQWQK